MEFETRYTLIEDILSQYFHKDFSLLIKLWINREGQKLDSWNVLITKTKRAKAKAKIKASASHKMNQHCHRGYRLLNTKLTKNPHKEYCEKA